MTSSTATTELNEKTINELRAMCKERDLPVHGNKQRIIGRLSTAEKPQPGRSERYVGAGLTLCNICRAAVRVRSTQRTPMEDGRVLLTRNVICSGKHHHRYPLKEIVPVQTDPGQQTTD